MIGPPPPPVCSIIKRLGPCDNYPNTGGVRESRLLAADHFANDVAGNSEISDRLTDRLAIPVNR
jgi:hypothetical protein